MNNDKRYESSIRRGADALAREIDLEVLESLKKFDWDETVKNINTPREKIEKSEGSPRK